ncbi:MAG TPA: preprotein translocase subunit SecA [Dehalococcoidia bacterium]
MIKWLGKLIGDANEKELKKIVPVVERINALEPEVQRLSDAGLRAKTDEFKARLADGETLDDLLPEAFAVVREAGRRFVGMRHFDVQLIGGVVLHQGKIAEMKTGEGKTLVATLPLYLNALEGKGAHLVTVNDYLAKRDAQWMGPIYDALGLTVGVIQHDAAYLYSRDRVSDQPNLEHLAPVSRREAYAADITYGTNNEFGFDYLRDNMVTDVSQLVQRGLHYAIVDEVDNILIDEARTPLIISGPAEESTQWYYAFARVASRLQEEADYTIDHKTRTVTLTEAGIARVERALGIHNLYDPQNYRLTRYLDAALKAHALYKRDRDYVVKDGEVIIVDEFTGRLMFGRRYSEGLHQAIEAKEGVKIQRESVTLATITFQNLFRLYEKLAGMTGTAATEAEEFYEIYKLDVVVIPTHMPMIRQDLPDYVYRTEEAKFRAVVEEIVQLHQAGRPVLVGTVSIEKSEYLSALLKRRGIPHQVLNAKHHEREAQIVAQAGQPGAVTIATNMAGRGTDIKLGPGVAELGGLHIIGTERHEARRIDNQLRGRAGRQGDPGSSRFYVSFGDDIMKRFAPDWLPGMMQKLGMDDDTPIEHSWVSKAIETAQTKVEGYNFDIRKHVVQYDDVMNKHREVIYEERRKILEGTNLRDNVLQMVEQEITRLVETHLVDRDTWDLETLLQEVGTIFPLPDGLTPEELDGLDREEVLDRLLEEAERQYLRREQELGPETMRALERLVLLRTIDSLWVEHLTEMDEMRRGIGLTAYGQQDPLVAYKREAYDMFNQLMATIQRLVAQSIYRVQVAARPAAAAAPPAGRAARPSAAAGGPAVRKVGRNDPCPCGSGRKYKKCHGAAA